MIYLYVVLGACLLGCILTDVVDTIEYCASKPKKIKKSKIK